MVILDTKIMYTSISQYASYVYALFILCLEVLLVELKSCSGRVAKLIRQISQSLC
jgi:hypothetical protein